MLNGIQFINDTLVFHLCNLETGVAAWVYGGEWFQVHIGIQCNAVIAVVFFIFNPNDAILAVPT